ncbi:MAG TPA: radical SAM protein, partial [bacterium]|nr:radical SAM protein [bacterium]
SRLIQLKNEISHLKDLRKKRISVKAKPLELGITLTTRCNLRCIMCDFPSHEWDIPAGTVSEIKEFMPALRYIYWQGGEVFLSPYFSSLYDETQNYPELVQTFNTNGLLIDDKWAGKLMRNRNELIVSVDGATKEVYEKIRAGGKFKNLLKALETLAKHKNGDFRGSLKMAVVVMRSNYDQLERLIDLARTYRFDEMIFLRINGDYPEENIFSPPDNEALRYLAGMKQKLSTRAKKYGIGLNAEFFENLESPSSQTAEQLPGSRMRETRAPAFCTAPWKRLFIFRGGSVLPHCHCRRPVGDAGRESLESIWNGSAMKEFRRSILRKNIEDICSGGCII